MTDEIFTCQYCGKVCKNKMSKVRHEYFCKMNPDHDKHLENHRNTTLKASKSPEAIAKISKKIASNHESFLDSNPDERYEDFELTCKKCGCTFIRRLKIRHFKNNYRIPQFCCQEHANSHTHSEEERKRVSEALKKEHLHICPECGKEFMHIGTAPNTWCDECRPKHTHPNKSTRRCHHSTELHQTECSCCGKPLWVKTDSDVYCYECCEKMNMYQYQLYDCNGKRLRSEKTRQKYRDVQLKLVKSGKHKGWKSRNIKSYPEIFWENVLTNNGIGFEREVPTMRYFLDFVIKKDDIVIDLEIDGKQHKYRDRLQHDKLRDKKLRENGYLVYRIDWNEINSKRGSLKMKYKINQFLWWYNHLQ